MHAELEKLREEQRYMEGDLSSIQMRWHSVREEKMRAENMFHDYERTEEELERLADEKSQIELDEKVISLARVQNFTDNIFTNKKPYQQADTRTKKNSRQGISYS